MDHGGAGKTTNAIATGGAVVSGLRWKRIDESMHHGQCDGELNYFDSLASNADYTHNRCVISNTTTKHMPNKAWPLG